MDRLLGQVHVREGDSKTRDTTATISVPVPVNNGGGTVPYFTELSGTATPNSDYVSFASAATVKPGAKSLTVTVKIVGDTIREGSENFYVVFQPPASVGLASTRVMVVIDDND